MGHLHPGSSLPALVPAGAPSAEVSAAHWRALQSLAQLAAASPPAASSGAALQALQQLVDGSLQSVPAAVAATLDVPAALVPGLQQLQVAPSASVYQPDQVRYGDVLLRMFARALASGSTVTWQLKMQEPGSMHAFGG